MLPLQAMQQIWLSFWLWTLLGGIVQAGWGGLARAWLQSDEESATHVPREYAVSGIADYSQQSFREAERALSSLEEARICKREATLKLISSSTCKDMLKETRREEVEVIQELYAIQLAKCEIESASAKLPQSCQFDLNSLDPDSISRNTLKSKITSCLTTFQSKPQWWTSYSNHRRDGYDWCLIMKPGFDHNEHVKVWKNVYSALDISVQAIEDALHSILSWSRESKAALHEFGDSLSAVLGNFRVKADQQLESLELAFNRAGQTLQTRLGALLHRLTETEAKLKDVGLVAEENDVALNKAKEGIASLALAQESQIDQAAVISNELDIIQRILMQSHDNITTQQTVVMHKLATMLDVIDGLGHSALVASDRLENLNILLSSLTGFPDFWTLLKWSILVVGISFFSRLYAAVLVLAILCFQEVSSCFQGINFAPLNGLTSDLWTRLGGVQHFRLICIAAMIWYFAARYAKSYPWRTHIQYPYGWNTALASQNAHQQQLTLHIPQYPPAHIARLPFYNKRFKREGSSPL